MPCPLSTGRAAAAAAPVADHPLRGPDDALRVAARRRRPGAAVHHRPAARREPSGARLLRGARPGRHRRCGRRRRDDPGGRRAGAARSPASCWPASGRPQRSRPRRAGRLLPRPAASYATTRASSSLDWFVVSRRPSHVARRRSASAPLALAARRASSREPARQATGRLGGAPARRASAAGPRPAAALPAPGCVTSSRTEHHGVDPQLLVQVVVVALEGRAGHPQLLGEAVELLEALVAHEVAPLAAPEPPAALVDEQRHAAIMTPWKQELRDRWAMSPGPAGRRRGLDSLLARYREPHRHYHGLAHLLRACCARSTSCWRPCPWPIPARCAWRAGSTTPSTTRRHAGQRGGQRRAWPSATCPGSACEPARVDAVVPARAGHRRPQARRRPTRPCSSTPTWRCWRPIRPPTPPTRRRAAGVRPPRRRRRGARGEPPFLRSFLDRHSDLPHRADARAGGDGAGQPHGRAGRPRWFRPTGGYRRAVSDTAAAAPETVVEAIAVLRALGYTADAEVRASRLRCGTCDPEPSWRRSWPTTSTASRG